MTTEPQKDSRDVSGEGIGTLGGCFVEGNPEQRSREGKLRRGSLVVSVFLQAAILAAVVLIPLFGKPERVALAYTPIPPYYHRGSPKLIAQTRTPGDPGRRLAPCFFCPIAPTATHASVSGTGPTGPSEPIDTVDAAPCPGCLVLDIPVGQPQPPSSAVPRTELKTLKVARLDPAMLIRRMEPVYPALPRQMRREGRVELHAIIAADGTIQSLQAVGGDAMFYMSALEAVRQWEYQPTILNGQPVQIETTITVIYRLNP